MTERDTELERAYERINQLEDLLGDAFAYIAGNPEYENARAGIITDINAYFDARRRARGELAPENDKPK